MKRHLILILILLLSGTLLFAEESVQADSIEDLYNLVVPMRYDNFSVFGGLGGNSAARIVLDLAPSTSFTFNLGAGASYNLVSQTVSDAFRITATINELSFSSSGFVFDSNVDGSYSSYSFDAGNVPGFYRVGVSPFILSANTSSFTSIEFSPYAAIGIGRFHDITRLKEMELDMRYLGIEPTAERLRQAAMVRYKEDEYLNRYSEYNTDNHVAYHQELADAYGASDRMLEFLYLDQSQAYQFDRSRYQGMRNGWEAEARLRPTVDYKSYRASPSTLFSMNLDLAARYADFTMDDVLYYQGAVQLSPGLNFTPNTSFNFRANLIGQLTYLPPQQPWFVEGMVYLDFYSEGAPRKLRMIIVGDFNYLITPNFTTFATLQLNINQSFSATTRLMVSAGGSIRIW